MDHQLFVRRDYRHEHAPMAKALGAHLCTGGRSHDNVVFVDDVNQPLVLHARNPNPVLLAGRCRWLVPQSVVMASPRPTTFSTHNLDRFGDQRKDPAWLAAALERETTRVHIVHSGQVATVGERSASVEVHVARALTTDDTWVLLGDIGGVAHFALDASLVPRDSVEKALHEDAMFVALRDAASVLHADDANMLAFASGIATWHVNHRHCGRCGTATEVRAAGHERHCPTCGYDCFPRTDPAMIVLVHDHANERCVLGRQKIWPPTMYSTLAGFLEPGESLEDTVRREVKEEVGLIVDDVRYVASQPWPFPQSVMIGYLAEAITEDLHVHPTELDDARWFARSEIVDAAAMGRRGNPMIPPPVTIARRLIDAWLGV
jgi:NAD+ diphosphatase